MNGQSAKNRIMNTQTKGLPRLRVSRVERRPRVVGIVLSNRFDSDEYKKGEQNMRPKGKSKDDTQVSSYQHVPRSRLVISSFPLQDTPNHPLQIDFEASNHPS